MKRNLFALGLLALVSHSLESKATYHGNGFAEGDNLVPKGVVTTRCAILIESEKGVLMTEENGTVDLLKARSIMPDRMNRPLGNAFESLGVKTDANTLVISKVEPGRGNIDVLGLFSSTNGDELPLSSTDNIIVVPTDDFRALMSGQIPASLHNVRGLGFGLQRLIKDGTTSGPIDPEVGRLVAEFFQRRDAARAVPVVAVAEHSATQASVAPSAVTATFDDSAASVSTSAAGSSSGMALEFDSLEDLPPFTADLERSIIRSTSETPQPVRSLFKMIKDEIEGKVALYKNQYNGKALFLRDLKAFWSEAPDLSFAAAGEVSLKDDSFVTNITRHHGLTLSQIEDHIIASASKAWEEVQRVARTTVTTSAVTATDDAVASASTSAASSSASAALSLSTLEDLPLEIDFSRFIINATDETREMFEEMEGTIDWIIPLCKFEGKTIIRILRDFWEGKGDPFKKDKLVTQVVERGLLSLDQIEAHIIAVAVKKFKEQHLLSK